MRTSTVPTMGATGEALPDATCSLYPSPSMAEDEGLVLQRAFELAGIPVAMGGALAVHAIEPFSGAGVPASKSVEAAKRALRVRRLGTRCNGPVDWAAEVTADLAAWMLASPPPEGSVVDVVVPASPGSTAPRLANGLVDSRHIWISAHDHDVEPSERDALRHWARNVVEVMRSRWSADGAACPCC